MPETRMTYQVASSPARVTVVAGSPTLDPLMREYLLLRWRTCMTELRWLAQQLGWQDRLPPRQD